MTVSVCRVSTDAKCTYTCDTLSVCKRIILCTCTVAYSDTSDLPVLDTSCGNLHIKAILLHCITDFSYN